MNHFEKSLYVNLEHKFEGNLNRELKDDEKEFLKWLAKKQTKEAKRR